MSAFAGRNRFRQLLATVTVAGPVSGVINNTPVVAILVPVVSDLAHEGGTSPSKLLMPLSYASMLGGTLTLVGTSTNILASATAERLIGRGFSMFEFTALGAVVLIVGTAYLLTVGSWLLPERIPAGEGYLYEYGIDDYLTEVEVAADSPVAGLTVAEAFGRGSRAADVGGLDTDVDVVQVVRDGRTFGEPLGAKQIRAGDRLRLRTDRDSLADLVEVDGLEIVGTPDEAKLESATPEQTLRGSGRPLGLLSRGGVPR